MWNEHYFSNSTSIAPSPGIACGWMIVAETKNESVIIINIFFIFILIGLPPNNFYKLYNKSNGKKTDKVVDNKVYNFVGF